MPSTLEDAFSALPKGLSGPLLKEYREAIEAARSRKWETVGLKAGKLCEIIHTILKGHVDGSFPRKPSKPNNMVDACTALEAADKTKFSRPVRIQIPRMLIGLYELRNNRAIGHIGGDVDPNEMDGELFLRSVKWLVAELVRVFHAIDVAQAAALVDMVSERSVPLIWTSGDRIRVLNPKLSMPDRTLLMLHHFPGGMKRPKLCEAVEHSNLSVFTKSVLQRLHKRALVDFDRKADTATILPPGSDYVEEKLLKR